MLACASGKHGDRVLDSSTHTASFLYLLSVVQHSAHACANIDVGDLFVSTAWWFSLSYIKVET
jgi:hypothetical protein